MALWPYNHLWLVFIDYIFTHLLTVTQSNRTVTGGFDVYESLMSTISPNLWVLFTRHQIYFCMYLVQGKHCPWASSLTKMYTKHTLKSGKVFNHGQLKGQGKWIKVIIKPMGLRDRILKDCHIEHAMAVQTHVRCVTRKRTLRSLSLSYQKKDGRWLLENMIYEVKRLKF